MARSDGLISERTLWLIVALALTVCALPGAQAATSTWVAGGAAGDATDSQNWNGNTLPGPGDNVLFNNSGQSPLEDIFLNSTAAINSVTINLTDGSNQNWNFGADDSTSAFTLTLTTGNVSVLSTSGTGTYILGATSGTGIGTGILTVATSATGFTIDNSRTNGGLLQVNAIVSGLAKTVTKTGVGTVILSGANTYTGTTTVSAGALNIQNATGLGSIVGGTNVSSGATLQLQNNITVGGEALTISGTGASGQNGALVNVSGTNNYAGLVTLAAASTISSDSGTLNLTNIGTITGATFGLTLTGSGSGTISSIIGTTTGTLTKSGTGTWTLLGASTFTGNTIVNAGTLTLASSLGVALSAASTITVNSGGTLLLGANNQLNISATISLAGGTFAKGNFGAGAISSVGLGALTLTATGSHIDFGIGTVGVLSFASFNPGANTLAIDNWTGTANTVGSALTDRLIFDSDQTANLSSFNFAGYAPGATEFALGGGFFEIVPVDAVPEPSTWFAATLVVIAIAWCQRHCFTRGLARRVRFPANWLSPIILASFSIGVVSASASPAQVLPEMGDLSRWALFSLGNNGLQLSGNAAVEGDVGAAGNGIISIRGHATIDGNLYYRRNSTLVMDDDATITGARYHNGDPELDNGVNEASRASDHAFALAPTRSYTHVNLVRNQSITVQGVPGETVVLNLKNFVMQGSATFTLQGTATTNFIINVTRQFSLSGFAKVVLSGGVQWNNVLFNVRGQGGDVIVSGNARLEGILMANLRTVRLSGQSRVTGEVIANRIIMSNGSQVIHSPVVSP